jgi:hypothetical protein
VIESRQQGTSLPLAMTEVLPWNQMEHNKGACESHIYVRDSATRSYQHWFSEDY